MVTRTRKLLLIGLTLAFALILLAGAAVNPPTARSDFYPQTYCRWYWDGTLNMWCYRCCDIYGCENLWCQPEDPF